MAAKRNSEIACADIENLSVVEGAPGASPRSCHLCPGATGCGQILPPSKSQFSHLRSWVERHAWSSDGTLDYENTLGRGAECIVIERCKGGGSHSVLATSIQALVHVWCPRITAAASERCASLFWPSAVVVAPCKLCMMDTGLFGQGCSERFLMGYSGRMAMHPD